MPYHAQFTDGGVQVTGFNLEDELEDGYGYNTIQYNTIQYNTIQYNTIQYNTIQYKPACTAPFPCQQMRGSQPGIPSARHSIQC